jgi:GMP synthase-like glutamine amidotransferase
VGLLRAAAAAEVPVLGLCWGGQALAAALGGVVAPAPQPERGWLAIESHDRTIPSGPWLHYHYDMFSVPPGATEVARTPVGPSAYRIGAHLGLQFHPEATPAIGEIWGHADPDLSLDEVRALARAGTRFGAAAREQAFALFDAWRPRG